METKKSVQDGVRHPLWLVFKSTNNLTGKQGCRNIIGI